ncbi:microsomal glutathione S-transferase 1-like [Loxodonta africana]|uniref:microsomal glutathione S-transferase 1-like n=1 Tax=Loxodonta africana TaxID=9785 RepID=UPI0030CE8F0B
MVDLIQLMENEVFTAFVSFTTNILSKLMFVSTATALYRSARKVFVNPEDCAQYGKGKNAKRYLWTHGVVEHIQRPT